jgi:hypothetical protein
MYELFFAWSLSISHFIVLNASDQPVPNGKR